MRTLLRITLRPPRAYVLGRRLHHGPVGIVVALAGMVTAYTDWHDRRVWVRDFRDKGGR